MKPFDKVSKERKVSLAVQASFPHSLPLSPASFLYTKQEYLARNSTKLQVSIYNNKK